ncbi:MAG: PEP-CTERM sorting domain-containing protein [Armatimonadota bacterium]
MRRSFLVAVILTVAVILMSGSGAFAYVYKLHSNTTPWYQTTFVGGPSGTYWIGGEQISATHQTNSSLSFTKWMYCIDLRGAFTQDQGADLYGTPQGSALYPSVNPNIDALKWDQISWLVNNYAPEAISVNDSALQAAIWELGNETTTTWDVTSGNFQVLPSTYHNGNVSNLTAQANIYLGYVAGAGNLAGYATANNQHYMHDGQDFTWKQPVVPEPASMILGALGLAVVGGLKRKRNG